MTNRTLFDEQEIESIPGMVKCEEFEVSVSITMSRTFTVKVPNPGHWENDKYISEKEPITEKDVRLEILERSYMYDNVIPMVTMDLTYDELSDFAFHVFFATIIDLEFPEECRDKLEQIEMFVSNYQVYKLQNQNI